MSNSMHCRLASELKKNKTDNFRAPDMALQQVQAPPLPVAGNLEEVTLPISDEPTRPLYRYVGTTCVTCNAPLNLSEQEANLLTPTIRCSQDKSHVWQELRKHVDTGYHDVRFVCSFQGCQESMETTKRIAHHYATKHPKSFRCVQCSAGFDR